MTDCGEAERQGRGKRRAPLEACIDFALLLQTRHVENYELDDHFHDQCGVFGVFGAEEASNLAYLGLHSLQHRGQEAAGIASSDGAQLFVHRAQGLVQDGITPAVLAQLPGANAIGHVRYSTAGGNHLKNAQPIAVDSVHGSIAVAHNGNLTNADELRAELEELGSIFQTTSDTEVIVHLIARSKKPTTRERVIEALKRVEGAYSLLFLTTDELIAVRDPRGFRPLCLGKRGDAWALSSEPPAFELIVADYVRDVEPGELVTLTKDGLHSDFPFVQAPRKMCVFEYVYFARPDSQLNGRSVYEARKELGRTLANEAPAKADVVIPVPDSGVPAALGYAAQSKIPYDLGLIRSHYVGRTFIEPSQSIRHFGVRLKLSPVREVLAGKRVVVVDDSIVRGTTSRKIVRMLRDAGAKEVHLRISSPPTRWPCFYGIDTPSRSELVASTHSPEEIAKYVASDSLGYLSLEGLHNSVARPGLCDACFTGAYPVAVAANDTRPKTKLPIVGV